MLNNFIAEFERYKIIGERALAQIPDDALKGQSAQDNLNPTQEKRS